MNLTGLQENIICFYAKKPCYNFSMKKIFRMLIFSAFSLFLTSLWNGGFVLGNLPTFLTATLVLAVVFYIIIPLSKILLLPFNIITLGFMSFFVYIVILHFSSSTFHLFNISSWKFQGINLYIFSLPKMQIPYLLNLVLSSLSISSIINILEQLL